jgi:hypothetical protein
MRGQGGQCPVFVDVSGRRQRRLRVAGAFGVLLAVGYVCVLLSTVMFSTVLGGPPTHSPFLSLPPVRGPATVGSVHLKPAPATSRTSVPRQPSVVGVALAVPVVMPAVMPTSSPTAGSAPTSGPTSTTPTVSPTPSSTSSPTSSPTVSVRATGKPTAMPTPANRPTKP